MTALPTRISNGHSYPPLRQHYDVKEKREAVRVSDRDRRKQQQRQSNKKKKLKVVVVIARYSCNAM